MRGLKARALGLAIIVLMGLSAWAEWQAEKLAARLRDEAER